MVKLEISLSHKIKKGFEYKGKKRKLDKSLTLIYTLIMKALKFGVVGVGNMGKIHSENIFLNRLNGVKLGAVSDCDPQALKWCKEHLKGIPAYQDYHEMLDKENLDGVVVVTPHYFHPEVAIAALKAHCHVLIEKPLAVTCREAKTIIAEAGAHPDLVCGVAFNQRSNAVYRKAKEIISSGRLGKIRAGRYDISDWYRPDSYYRMNPWRGSYALEGGGCLINQCHHQLDIIYWLLGLPEDISAHCQTVDRKMTAENDVTAVLSYPGFDFVLTASSHDLKGQNIIDISGDLGRLVIEKTKMTAYFHEDEVKANKDAEGYGGVKSKAEVYKYGWQRLKDDKAYGQQLRSLRAFRNAIWKQGPLLAPVAEGLGADELLNGIYMSSWTHQSVHLPVDEDKYDALLKEQIQKEKHSA